MKIEFSEEEQKAIHDRFLAKLQEEKYQNLYKVKTYYKESINRFYAQVELLTYCVEYTFNKDGSTTENIRIAIGCDFDFVSTKKTYPKDTRDALVGRLINHAYSRFPEYIDAGVMTVKYARRWLQGDKRLWKPSPDKLSYDFLPHR